jgi:hypothetical protein
MVDDRVCVRVPGCDACVVADMSVLFEDVVQSINFDQHEILKDIIKLHCPGGFELDPCFGLGGFYKGGVPLPKYCFDIEPRDRRATEADCRRLPFKAREVGSIIFDPPFLAGGGDTGKMNARYRGGSKLWELEVLYEEALTEFQRILQPQGILVFKCQDILNGRQNNFMHVFVYEAAREAGFVGVDLFVKLNKTAMIPHNFVNQYHARKMHSYFWVFKKLGRRRLVDAD